ncbi:MAG: FdhF/YdeP family oxidoreductase [Phycisphaeraceae bacterium]|nr:FdhF/YdeP family oxidoreductase [Phycisphaeraceae bacterium]
MSRRPRRAGGFTAILYTLRKGRQAGGILRLYRALRAKNACKTCALGMGGQAGGMVDEKRHRLEVCKKSVQAMAADMAGAIRPEFFRDFTLRELRAMSPRELEAAGRITMPLVRGPLDDRYRPVSWDDALSRIADRLRRTAPDESFFYFSGRSSNEAGFLLQLAARLYGTNNVNNCSFYCHQASGVGLRTVTGSGAGTVELADLDRCDCLVLIGANPASNHPRFMKSVVALRRRGGRVIVINPLRELGLERFAVPSDPISLLFGSKTSDLYLQPNVGGDIAVLTGLARIILERGAADQAFIDAHTENVAAFRAQVTGVPWPEIERAGAVPRSRLEEAADLLIASKRTIFCWAMGITHHEHGVANVQAIGNLALLLGMAGRPGAGLLPLRGHSNVQGIGSVGVTPVLQKAIFDGLEARHGVTLPTTPGRDTLACMEAARAGAMRCAVCLGGNLYGSNPDARFAAEAFASMDTVVYLSTTLNTGHAWGTGRETFILPVRARDEEPEPTTQESMFSYVRLSDGGPARFEGPRGEVEVIADLAERLLGTGSPIDFASLRQHRNIRRIIADVVPGYQAVGEIDATRHEFHVAGRLLHAPRFHTESGRARFHAVPLPPPPPDAPTGTDGAVLRLTTIRSEGQFNTVVYEDEDRYRGQARRDVILMHAADVARMNLREHDRVTVRSTAGEMTDVIVRTIDIPPGNAAMYYPEANILVPRRVDPASRTPAFKCFMVRVSASRRD